MSVRIITILLPDIRLFSRKQIVIGTTKEPLNKSFNKLNIYSIKPYLEVYKAVKWIAN